MIRIGAAGWLENAQLCHLIIKKKYLIVKLNSLGIK